MATTEILPFGEIIAMAPPSGQPGGSGLMSFLPMILIFIAFYFLLIRPQRQKQKQHEKMVQALEKGAKVKTTGGMFGPATTGVAAATPIAGTPTAPQAVAAAAALTFAPATLALASDSL
mgnify:CR=1 FL=1